MSPNDCAFPLDLTDPSLESFGRCSLPDAVHPAHTMPFADLLDGLETALAAGLVSVSREGDLSLWSYTDHCIQSSKWNQPVTVAARGLVLDEATRRVVATPFPKVFGFTNQRTLRCRDQPFRVFEKLDGSLITVWFHEGRWRATGTTGFHTAETAWAQHVLDRMDLSPLVPGSTYLFEAVGPQNRLVVCYDEPALVMLAAYAEDGVEVAHETVRELALRLGLRTAREYRHATLCDILDDARMLRHTEAEGFIVRFASGFRAKVRADGYMWVRARARRIEPPDIWKAMLLGDDLEAMRQEIPDACRGDFDAIRAIFDNGVRDLAACTAQACARVAHMTDKELGLALSVQPEPARRFLFHWRRAGGTLTDKMREKFMLAIKPGGKALEGYAPSAALRRMLRPAQ
jgi:RNA ligase